MLTLVVRVLPPLGAEGSNSGTVKVTGGVEVGTASAMLSKGDVYWGKKVRTGDEQQRAEGARR